MPAPDWQIGAEHDKLYFLDFYMMAGSAPAYTWASPAIGWGERMEQREKGAVILLPQTVDYYQMQLTRMLEDEQYGEAMELLRFLLQCRPDDPRTAEEWNMLLEWIESEFSRTKETAEDEDLPGDETELLKAHVAGKASQDRRYGQKLMHMLAESPSVEKQLLALEQLAYIDDRSLDRPLVEWIRRRNLHPLVQFKGLQTLKQRGFTAPVQVFKEGEKVLIDPDEVPVSWEDFPRLVQQVAVLVEERCEVQAPGLAYFAVQLWKEFLAFAFGTKIYQELVKMQEEDADVWASALHIMADRLLGGEADPEAVMLLYGLTDNDRNILDRICKTLAGMFGGGRLP